ncbi:MAG: NAD-dependent epimerase/dehydratase family protein [Elusimicrobiota bacterium]
MKFVVTGGAGFIGSNVSRRLLSEGHRVVIVDALARKGVTANVEWLKSGAGRRLQFHRADVRDARSLRGLFRGADGVFHFAAQVAVTTSVADPRMDFETNALGAFNVLEACRRECPRAVFHYTSTNKVYGGMEDVGVRVVNGRYAYNGLPGGVPESRGLDFHSPYGCSKGAADQYARDYHRIYGLRTVVFRMSCIYGPRQFGNEDQGWVAHFCIAALQGKPIRIYGDGRQVRDLLFVDDLVEAFLLSMRNIRKTQGRVFNVGGGPENTLSLRELTALLEKELGRRIPLRFSDWRPGDQRVYVSETKAVERTLGWKPVVRPAEGVRRLLAWIATQPSLARRL